MPNNTAANDTKDNMLIVRTHDVALDNEYLEWMHDIKDRYRRSQVKAAVKVNAEQLLFNWQLGRDLVTKKAEEKWGSGIVEQVSLDLQAAFPDSKSFSTRNLWFMKQWYSFYFSENDALDRIRDLERQVATDSMKLNQVGSELEDQKLNQVGSEIPFPAIFAFVPWRHHVLIVQRCESVEEALFYIRKTVEEGWSRSTLDNCLRADMYHTMGTAITNFDEKLPAAQSDLAQDLLKGNYDLGFITLPKNYNEADLEDAIEKHITRFLLELGEGWAFIGRQKEVIVSGKSRRIDLLFYHIYLRSYVVLELKANAFEPEFAGKLNFYVNAVDATIRRESDNQTIGLLICKEMDHTEVQLAFQGITTPMGVATYDNVKLEEIQKYLPTVEQFRQQIEIAEKEFRRNNTTENSTDIQ